MKKSIARKIEQLLASIVTSNARHESTSHQAAEHDPEEEHFEKNPDRSYNIKLPARLAALLRPKRNPGFR